MKSVLAPFALLKAPYDDSKEHRVLLRRGISALISTFTNAISVTNLSQPSDHTVTIRKLEQIQVELLKQLTRHYVIEHPRVVSIRRGQRQILRYLFEVYLEAISRQNARDLALLPQATRDPLDSGDSAQRLTADLLASMTERQVIQTHQRLTGLVVGLGSHFDV